LLPSTQDMVPAKTFHLQRFLERSGTKWRGVARGLCSDEREDTRKLRLVLKKAGKYSLDLRLRAIQLLSKGTSIEQTTSICEVGTVTVKRRDSTYRSEGLRALISKGPCQSKQPRLSGDRMKELADIIEAGPEESGIDGGLYAIRRF
jgi:hypothetical protein